MFNYGWINSHVFMECRRSLNLFTAYLLELAPLRQWLPFADADISVSRHVVPPSAFQSVLLAGRGNPGSLSAVALSAGGDKVSQTGGSALGPGRNGYRARRGASSVAQILPPSRTGHRPLTRAIPSRRCWRVNPRTGSRRRTSRALAIAASVIRTRMKSPGSVDAATTPSNIPRRTSAAEEGPWPTPAAALA